MYECVCECGVIREFDKYKITSGHTKSCGCLQREEVRNRKTSHGDSGTKLYNTWKGIRARCNNPKNSVYKYYGRRGITVSDEWNEYINFKNWALNNGYKEELTIDRIDNNKGYYPENCRWVDMTTQIRNRSNSWYVEIDGEVKHYVEWCELYGIDHLLFQNRIRQGWSEERALKTPKNAHLNKNK